MPECKKHGLMEAYEKSGRIYCRQCRSDYVIEWRRRVKAKLVAALGGSCKVCGYSKYNGALHFHHLDPTLKKFGISQAYGITKAYERSLEEAKKCILLCANCHAEVEAGITKLPDTQPQ